MSKWSGEKSALKLDIFSFFFFWKHLNQQRKNALKERLKRLGEYGEVSRQFNVQIFPLLLSFHA